MIDEEFREWEREERKKDRALKDWRTKKNATFRLPVALLTWLKSRDNQAQTIIDAVCEKYKLSPKKPIPEEEKERPYSYGNPRGRLTISLSQDILEELEKISGRRSTLIENLIRRYYFR